MANHNHDPSSSIIDENEKSPKGVSRRVAVVGGAATALGLILAACGKKKPEANESSTPAEPLNEDFKGSPNNVETAPAEPHYVESGMDPNEIYGATEISTAIPGEQALMIAEMLIQWDPTKEPLVTGYYPKAHQETDENGYPVRNKDGEIAQTIEVVTLGSNPDKEPSIADSMEKDLAILRMALAMVQDPDAHIRRSGSAILDTFVDNAVSLNALTQFEESVSVQGQAKLYGDTTSTEALISGSELVEAIKAYPTNPEELEEIAPWLNKEVTITAASDVSRNMENPTKENTTAKVVAIAGSYKNDQNMDATVVFVVQPTSILTDPSGMGRPYEAAQDISYKVDSQAYRDWAAFENVPSGKSKSTYSMFSSDKYLPEDTWPYNE